MNKKIILTIAAIAVLPCCAHSAGLRALIVDGQNNHNAWPKTTIMMRQYLEETGLYETVDIARTKFLWNSDRYSDWLPYAGVAPGLEKGSPVPDPGFSPDFSQYDVVISNFGFRAAEWSEQTQRAFETYMRYGGGFVSVHAADNSFPDWQAYNQMIGIGGWGGRTKEHGPYWHVNELGKVIRDDSEGRCGAHGPREDFVITMREPEHPISKNLPEKWLHADDECYALMRGPGQNMKVLGYAKSSVSARNEPMLMAITYGKGRIFHTTLGHDTAGFECVGFITTFKRGVEWAATGKVTQTAIPADFPNVNEISQRPFEYTQQTDDASQEYSILTGDYLGQTPPGDTPVVFASGVISKQTNNEHSAPAFPPQGDEVFWFYNRWPVGDESASMHMRRENGQWTTPKSVPFGLMPAFSPDGQRVYFYDFKKSAKDSTDQWTDIWFSEKDHNGEWKSPECLDLVLKYPEMKGTCMPSITRDGTLYFVGHLEGARSNVGIYCTKLMNGEYTKPKLLPDNINLLPYLNWTPYIAPDESYLIFSSSRKGGLDNIGDLYVSFRQTGHSWTEPVSLGEPINTPSQEYCPGVSPDGKYLFFCRWVRHEFAHADVFWVSTQVIDELKKQHNGIQK